MALNGLGGTRLAAVNFRISFYLEKIFGQVALTKEIKLQAFSLFVSGLFLK